MSSPHSTRLAVAVVTGVVGTSALMYFTNQRTKAVDAPASIYKGDPAAPSRPLGSSVGHETDARMTSADVRQHVSGGGKPDPKN